MNDEVLGQCENCEEDVFEGDGHWEMDDGIYLCSNCSRMADKIGEEWKGYD